MRDDDLMSERSIDTHVQNPQQGLQQAQFNQMMQTWMDMEQRKNEMAMASHQQIALYGAQQNFDSSKYAGKFFPDKLSQNNSINSSNSGISRSLSWTKPWRH